MNAQHAPSHMLFYFFILTPKLKMTAVARRENFSVGSLRVSTPGFPNRGFSHCFKVWCSILGAAKNLSVFRFVRRMLSFSVDLLLNVSAPLYCMYCKEYENILNYFDGVITTALHGPRSHFISSLRLYHCLLVNP